MTSSPYFVFLFVCTRSWFPELNEMHNKNRGWRRKNQLTTLDKLTRIICGKEDDYLRMNKHLDTAKLACALHSRATCYQFQTNHITRNTDCMHPFALLLATAIENWNAFTVMLLKTLLVFLFSSYSFNFASLFFSYPPSRYDSIELF